MGQHHEKWDGSGYPFGLAGEEIDPNARIFAVVDAFDAMISDRVYRAGKTYDAAAAELTREAGKHFDPQVVEAFHRISRKEWEELYERRGGVPAQAVRMGRQSTQQPIAQASAMALVSVRRSYR